MQTSRSLIAFSDDTRALAKMEIRGPQAARVVAYDEATQLVNLAFPLPVPVRTIDEDGEERIEYRRQVGVDDVGVAFLGGPAGGLSVPIVAGMEGVFIPFEADHSGYLTTAEDVQALHTTERHTVGCGGIFYPMPLSYAALAPAAPGATVLSGDDVRLAEATATEAMARADRVEAQLAALAGRLYFMESYINQLQPWLIAAAAYLLPLGVTAPLPAQQLIAGVPFPPLGVPVGAWLNTASAPPWLAPGTPLPAGYAGTGNTGADKVKGV